MWNLISVHLVTVLVLVQVHDLRQTTSGSEILLDAPDGTPT
jgi:hypothetical protein